MTRDTVRHAARRRALLLIDFQEDFLDARGRMPVCRTQAAPAVEAAARAAEAARQAGDLVVAVGNEFRPGDRLMNLLRRNASIAGSDGARWSHALALGDARYFPKWTSSAFANPDLDAWLRANDVGTLALCGLFAKACVSATCKDALSRGYVVELLLEAIACSSDGSRSRALARLEAEGARVYGLRHGSSSAVTSGLASPAT